MKLLLVKQYSTTKYLCDVPPCKIYKQDIIGYNIMLLTFLL